MHSFEYDENKSQINQSKHGINFNDAQLLWNDPDLVVIPAKKAGDEIRSLVIGLINSKHWSAIITYRDKNIRIISVRRSRIEEVNFYEE
ncbi:MAG: uncharacterized DUF497 family protein [Polaribacter sp.]|jgi:uncharacterized DUF497 family protein